MDDKGYSRPKGRPKGRRKAGCGFLLVVALYQSGAWTEIDMAIAFYRTLAACDPPEPQEDGTCPKGTRMGNSTSSCMAIPHGEEGWSGSMHCGDQREVVRQSLGLAGELAFVANLCAVLANSVLGTLLLDSWGRKPMMVISMSGLAVQTVVFGMVSLSGHSLDLFSGVLLTVAMVLSNLPNTFVAASAAMAVDDTEPDSDERSIALVNLNMAKTTGTLFGFGTGFFVLKLSLTDYTLVWAAFSVILVVIATLGQVLLQETKPARPKDELQKTLSDVGTELCTAFKLVKRDGWLTSAMCAQAIAVGACIGVSSLSGSWAFMVCGHSQAVASLTGVVQPIFIILGSALVPFATRCLGQWGVFFISWVLIIAGHVLTGLGGMLDAEQDRRVAFWGGFGVVLSIGYGLNIPIVQALLSARVDDAHQGKFFAVNSMATGIMVAIGIFIWTNVLLNDQKQAREQMTQAWFIAVVVDVVVTVWWVCIYFAQDTRQLSRGAADVRERPLHEE